MTDRPTPDPGEAAAPVDPAAKERHERMQGRMKPVMFGILLLLGLSAFGLAWGELPGWLVTLAGGLLWSFTGLVLLTLISMQVGHFVFAAWPMDSVEMPDGTRRPIPPSESRTKSHPSRRWYGKLLLLGILMALFVADRTFLAVAYLYILMNSGLTDDQEKVMRAGWDSRVLGPLSRIRYMAVKTFIVVSWRVLSVPWHALRYFFIAIATIFGFFVFLYEKNIVARRAMQIVFWILAVPVVVLVVVPVVVLAAPFILAWKLSVGNRDCRAIRKSFDRPNGLIYFLFSEPHQYKEFMGEGGVLEPVRDHVVARDWRANLAVKKEVLGWEHFAASPEGRMLGRLGIRTMRDHLPLIAVARPWYWLRVCRLNEPYRARMRDEGMSLTNKKRWIHRAVRWAVPPGP